MIRLSTVQVDLDGSWVLQQYASGIRGGTSLADDELFATGLPRMLALFREAGVRATCFVNGLDLQDPGKRDLLARLAEEGHEVASHGLDHQYFHLLDRAQKVRQVSESADLIADLCGSRPRGFRAPGFAVDGELPGVLEQAGYRYDASTFPTVVTPLLAVLERCLFGRSVRAPRFWPLLGSMKPYRPSRENLYRPGTSSLLELPVTTMPLTRLPLHFSYGAHAGAAYLRHGIELAFRRVGVVTFLFHLVDFADPAREGTRSLGPAVPLSRRIALARSVLELLCRRSRVMRADELVETSAPAFAAI